MSTSGLWWEIVIVVGAGSSLVVICAAVMQRFAKSATWGKAIWQGCFVGLCALLACELSGARWVAQEVMRTETKASVNREVALGNSPALFEHSLHNVEGVSAQTSSAKIPDALSHARNTQTWNGWVPGLVWLGGVIVVGLLFMIRRSLLTAFRHRCAVVTDPALLAKVQQLARQLGIRGRVKVLASKRLVSPISFGVLRPTICLPEDFAELFKPAEQEAVLLHELAHIAARDPLWHLLADGIAAALWWQPFVWWAQRELRNASEAAADEASLLLGNGPKALADALVHLGTRFTDRAGFKAFGVHGVRFRSGLGKRVQRLFCLPKAAWKRPSGWRPAAAQFLAPTVCVAAIVGCGAWATTSTKGEHMRTWKQSIAGMALLSMIQTLEAAPDTVDPTKPQSSTSLTALRPGDARTGSAAIPKLSELAASSRNAQAMRSKLEKIVLSQVQFDALPLGEVVKILIEESMRLDATKRGVNFVFAQPQFVSTTIDPATGLPVPNKGAEPIDMRSITVRIMPPLRDVRLIDVLEVITKVADQPLKYRIEEYGVVLSLAPPPGMTTVPESVEPKLVQTFKVDPQTFFASVKRTFGIEINSSSPDDIRAGLAQLLSVLGVDIYAPNKAAFYNELNGTLLVRADQNELVLIEAAMNTLGIAPNRAQ